MSRIVFCILYLVFCVSQNIPAQPVYSAKEGTASFFSKATIEDIQAESKSVNSFINTSNGEVVFIIPIRSFKFPKPLMQEHFNENYLESDLYPNATYKGKINETLDFTKDGTFEVTTTGVLTLHGVDQTRTEKGTLTVKDGQITLGSKFKVKLEDHKIKIPKIVIDNIAEVINVTLHTIYIPYVPQKK
jgi:polyisoprenoid-binding protein YceI